MNSIGRIVDSADEWYAGVSYGCEVGLYMYLFAVGSFPCLDRFFPGSHACSSVVCELDFGVLERIQARDIDVVSANLFAALELS